MSIRFCRWSCQRLRVSAETSVHAANARIEPSADEILGEPHDQLVIHDHLHPFAERPLALAGAPVSRDRRQSTM